MTSAPPTPPLADLSPRLLSWYDTARRDLPWRRTRDPYAIWLSEVMLQQTTVATVTPRWEQFLRRWPTVADLAAAPLEDVLHEWTGLGYYARARNLHRAAEAIVSLHDGKLPGSFEALKSLPGLGDYTAAAVASIAFGEAVPVIDANVERVMARLTALQENARSARGKEALRRAAAAFLHPDRPGDSNQAVMELGATLCTAREARCSECPLAHGCEANRIGTPLRFPILPGKDPMLPVREVAVLIRGREGRFLLMLRPPKGSFANMWEVPRSELKPEENHLQAAIRTARSQAGIDALKLSGPTFTFRHTVMRKRIELQVFTAELWEGHPRVRSHEALRWVTPEEWELLPKSTTQAKLLASLLLTEGQADDLFGDLFPGAVAEE